MFFTDFYLIKIPCINQLRKQSIALSRIDASLSHCSFYATTLCMPVQRYTKIYVAQQDFPADTIETSVPV